eukprot:581679-Hanusia_phi.AAC.1
MAGIVRPIVSKSRIPCFAEQPPAGTSPELSQLRLFLGLDSGIGAPIILLKLRNPILTRQNCATGRRDRREWL